MTSYAGLGRSRHSIVKPQMDTVAVVLERPRELKLNELQLESVGENDVAVDVDWSGISTGTERLLYTGRMPDFPGMGYPLVPGYESVGRISEVGNAQMGLEVGDNVFVPGAQCFGEIRGLFGGAASRLVVPAQRVWKVDPDLGELSTLFALAATARHAIAPAAAEPPDLIVGHGILGRLLARLTIALGHEPPTVWETKADRRDGAAGYEVIDPSLDIKKDYRTVCDVSGDAGLLDGLIGRIQKGGEIVLAGFYQNRLSFSFPPAFMKEMRMRVAAEWQAEDMQAVRDLVSGGRLSLDGLISHRSDATNAAAAYKTAFNDSTCVKMILDWRSLQ